MKMQTAFNLSLFLGLGLALAAPACVFDTEGECLADKTCTSGVGTTGQGGAGADGGGGATTTQGGGGGGPCDGCAGYCKDGVECVACLEHSHCTEPGAAKCDPDSNECVPCDPGDADAATQCAGVSTGSVCDAGTCVECNLGDESACTAAQTCDLLAKECVDVGPGDVGNCEPCTNDAQCETGHKCIPLDFPMGTLRGYYCLRPYPPACDQPFAVAVNNKPSISGEPAANYCGVNQDLTTCEAVRTLIDNWRCSGTDGMCSPDGIEPEVAVPGAICRDLAGGSLGNRCTYACGDAAQCLDAVDSPPKSTCGLGTPPGSPPQFCGG